MSRDPSTYRAARRNLAKTQRRRLKQAGHKVKQISLYMEDFEGSIRRVEDARLKAVLAERKAAEAAAKLAAANAVDALPKRKRAPRAKKEAV